MIHHIMAQVCTAQYFTWYLCLLPVALSAIRWNADVYRSAALWLLSVALWLLHAYLLEFLGWNVYDQVWMCSLLVHVAQVYVAVAILRSASA